MIWKKQKNEGEFFFFSKKKKNCLNCSAVCSLIMNSWISSDLSCVREADMSYIRLSFCFYFCLFFCSFRCLSGCIFTNFCLPTQHHTLLTVILLTAYLKTRDTTGNCQRSVFSLGVFQHIHKITKLWKFELNWSLKLRDNNERKNSLVTQSCLLSDGWFRDLKILNLRSRNQIRGKLLLFR